MKPETLSKIELLREITRQNRIIELRLKYNKCHHEQVKQCLKKQLENLQKQKSF